MIARDCRKPIEISLPLEAIEKTSVKEQSIGHVHPRALDFWRAWWPPTACRAALFASLVKPGEPTSGPISGPRA